MYSDFLSYVRTESERRILVNEIDAVVDSLYMIDGNPLENTLNKSVRSEISELFRTAKAKETNFLGFLKSLRQIILEMKTINITLAKEPTDEIIDSIHTWLTRNVGKELIINFGKDEDLIGGAQIDYQGKYFELSLKKELQDAIGNTN